MSAKRHRKFNVHLLPFSLSFPGLGLRTVYSHLLFFTKHNLSKILLILDFNHNNLSVIPATVFISLATANLSVDLPAPSLATRNMTTPNIKIQDEYISLEEQEEIIDEQGVLDLPTVKNMWFKISRVEPLSLEVIEDKDDFV